MQREERTHVGAYDVAAKARLITAAAGLSDGWVCGVDLLIRAANCQLAEVCRVEKQFAIWVLICKM